MLQAIASYILRGLRTTICPFVSQLFSEPVVFPSGRRVAIGRLLAEGGFSFVYVGTEIATGRQVALKKIICQDDDTKVAAKAEADIHERFTHANLLPLVDKAFQRHTANSRWEVCWFVFPLAKCSLRDEITLRVLGDFSSGQMPSLESAITPCQAITIMRGVCSGLQHMHREGVAHRDVKPENMLLQREAAPQGSFGTPLLMDFGSCGDTEVVIHGRRDALAETETAARLCTMQYRSPELFDVPTDIGVLSYALADVWSIGCSLYCCLFGYSPFEVEFDRQSPCRPRQVDCGHLRVLGAVPWPREGPRSHTPESTKALVNWILTADVKLRPDINKVLDRFIAAPTGNDAFELAV